VPSQYAAAAASQTSSAQRDFNVALASSRDEYKEPPFKIPYSNVVCVGVREVQIRGSPAFLGECSDREALCLSGPFEPGDCAQEQLQG